MTRDDWWCTEDPDALPCEHGAHGYCPACAGEPLEDEPRYEEDER
jgi:hypothetical protein